MSDSGTISSITEAAKNAGKGFIKGTTQEISQTVSQGFGQISGDQKTPQQIAQEIAQMKQEDAQKTQTDIINIQSQIRMESRAPEDRPNTPVPIIESSKKPLVNLGELVTKKRDNKENKIAAA